MIPSVVIVASDEQLRKELVNYIVSGRKFSVLDVFESGYLFLDRLEQVSPQVLVISDKLDMSPYKLIIEVMEHKPIPCLLVTTGVEEEQIDFPYALEYGIVDTIQISISENGIIPPNTINIRLNILSKLNVTRFLTQIKMINYSQGKVFDDDVITKSSRSQFIDFYPPSDQNVDIEPPIFTKNNKVRNLLVVIGASTGGPGVISAIVSKLPQIFPPTIIIQHMPPGFMEAFAHRLNDVSKIKVKIAENHEVIKSNVVYVCPGGYHLVMDKGTDKLVRFRLNDGPKVNFVKPAVDVTLFSAARIFGSKILTIILSGMGSDGTEGCRVVKSLGGDVWALDPSESVIYGMNKSIVEKGLSDKSMTINGILRELNKTVFL